MHDRPGLTLEPPKKHLWWVPLVIGVTALVVGAMRWHQVGTPADNWVFGAFLFGIAMCATAPSARDQLHVDVEGVRIRTLLRQRSIPWHEVVEIQVDVETILGVDVRRVTLLLRSGQARKLPVPHDRRDPHFDLRVAQLRVFHRDAVEG